MMPVEVPEIVGDSAAWLGLIVVAGSAISLLVGLLWKAFRIHDQILDMGKELKPNSGGSLRDQIDATRTMTEHNAQSLADLRTDTESAISRITASTNAICKANDDSHKEIHRRIDGLYELLAGPGPAGMHRIADWHRTLREREE